MVELKLQFTNYRRQRLLLAGCVVALIVSVTLPCFAHKINVFATAEGDIISGYAYSSGGDRIRRQPIVIENTDGAALGETTTDEKGEFTFTATQRIDHVIVLETADGHRATFTISADELSETLAAIGATPAKVPTESDVTSQQSEPEILAENPIKPDLAVPGMTRDDVAQIVEIAVSSQIRPLREQLEAYESTTRLHDILGGIGYIIGIAGIAFYFGGKRKNT